MPVTSTKDTTPATQQLTFTRIGTLNVGTYATGGVAVSAPFNGLSLLTDLDISPSGGYIPEWVKTNEVSGLVKVFRQKDPAAAGGADIPLPEVANGVDLSAINFRYRAVGA